MFGSGFGSSSAPAVNSQRRPQESDYKFTSTPTDSISSIAVNGTTSAPPTCLAATAWDNSVSLYTLQYSQAGLQAANPQSQIKHDAPVLCSDFGGDGNVLFTGSCDGVVKMWSVTQGPTAVQQVGKHDLAVKSLKFIPEKNLLLTASWDKTLKGWDCRAPNAVVSLNLSDRASSMDCNAEAVVVGSADRKIHIFSVTGGNKVAEFFSPMQYQTRCVSIFADRKGFAIGSIEGRIAIEYFDEMTHKNPTTGASTLQKSAAKNFAFKCHRDSPKAGMSGDIFPVHAISFHPKNYFASCGGDGTISVWDKDSRSRLSSLDLFSKRSAIVDCKFDRTGNLLFYAMSYDWSRGHHNYDPKATNEIFCHVVQPNEITPKPK